LVFACCNPIHETAQRQQQGEQIGRIVSFRAIIYYGQLFTNYTRSPIFGATFFHSNGLSFNFDKKTGFGYILGDFLANASGHPDQYVQV
jgi:hypothetical protein